MKSRTGSRFRLRPCFQRWVLLESAVTALGLLERFLTRPQALRIPSFVDRAIVAATPSACKYGVTTCDQGKFTLQRVDSVCSVYPAASAGCGQRFGRAPGGVPYPLSLVEATPSESSEANQDSPSPLASHLLEGGMDHQRTAEMVPLVLALRMCMGQCCSKHQ